MYAYNECKLLFRSQSTPVCLGLMINTFRLADVMATLCSELEQLCSRSSPAIYLFCRRPTISSFLNEHLLGSTFSSLIYILSPPPFPRIFSVETERSAYILGREKVAEGEMGSDEFMRERGQSDSSYYHGADGERLSLRRICFRFNE